MCLSDHNKYTVSESRSNVESLGRLILMTVAAGRFAPSPTGELHLGNLRTALAAWLSARSQSLDFIVRVEDLDRVTSSRAHETAQLRDLAVLNMRSDRAVVRQSERFGLYEVAIARLVAQERTYECFCTRREIRAASSAPNDSLMPEGAYPGTCRQLSEADRAALTAAGRHGALRLRAHDEVIEVVDEIRGPFCATVDDVVLRRNDGVPAYNLAVVVDDAAQGVAEVVRGDDLLACTPRQVLLQRLLQLPTPRYRHVPLVVGADGVRLAKRHGAITMGQLAASGVSPSQVLTMLAASLGLARYDEDVTLERLLARFDVSLVPREPWVLPVNLQRSAT